MNTLYLISFIISGWGGSKKMRRFAIMPSASGLSAYKNQIFAEAINFYIYVYNMQ